MKGGVPLWKIPPHANRFTACQLKGNIGHSEGASFITSLIKAVLSLENKVIPPNLHFDNPNPKSRLTKWLSAWQNSRILHGLHDCDQYLLRHQTS